jgi:hypothetical protein
VRRRLAIDIDSTLHHYWDELSSAARKRFGVDLPYSNQHTWAIPQLRPEQLRAVVAETHSDAAIARARPYPDAVQTVNGWHAAGHVIHVMSQRAESCHGATARWLSDIGLRYDELDCSPDKVGRAVQAGVEVLIDDSPINLARAIDEGIVAATLLHPWNRELCEDEDVVCAGDWRGLALALGPVLADDYDVARAVR